MKKVLILLLLYTAALQAQNKFKGKNIHGIFKTCITDSTVFFDSEKIVLILNHKWDNSDCGNRPKFTYKEEDWPSALDLKFDENRFVLISNKKNIFKNNTDSVNEIHLMPEFGQLKYDRKTGILILTLEKYNWSKTFTTEYRKLENLFILTEKK